MFSEDYILRQITQASSVVAKVLGLSKAGKFAEAHAVIDQAIEELLGLDASMVRQMDDLGIVNLLASLQGIDCGKLFVLADLFNLEGDVLASQNRKDESRSSYKFARELYTKFSAGCPDSLDTVLKDKLDEIQGKIGEV